METSKEKTSKDNVEKGEEDTSLGYDWLSFGGPWSSGWLKSAKEKTFNTLELVKKDLTEFGDAVASEATAIAANTVESVKQQAQNLQQIVTPVFAEDEKESEGKVVKNVDKQLTDEHVQSTNSGWKLPQVSEIANNAWVKTLVKTVKSIAQEETTTDEDQITEIISPKFCARDKLCLPNHLLYAIQTDRQTYISSPEGDEQLFLMWQEEFDEEAHDKEMNSLLSNCPRMREIYQELVPQEVSSSDFWERYFYKVHQMSLIERCKGVALDESFSTTASKEEKKNETEKDRINSHDSPDQHSNTDETWSFCSSTEMELQELQESKDDGSLTPKAEESPRVEKTEMAKSTDGWLNWED